MRAGKLVAVAVAAVTMVAVSAPADAQRWGGRHRHHNRVDGGDMLLGAVIAGGLFAVLSSADRDRRDAERYDVPPPPRPDVPPPEWLPNSGEPVDGYEAPAGDYGAAAGDYGATAGDYDSTFNAPGAAIGSPDDAADACAGAALSEAQRFARVASIGAIDAVDAAGGGWSVRGTIMLRNDYRTRAAERSFTCSIAGGSAPSVRIEGYGQ